MDKPEPSASDTEGFKKTKRARSIGQDRGNLDLSQIGFIATKSAYEFFSTSSLHSKRFRFLNCFKPKVSTFTKDDLQDSVLRLHKYCLTHLLDSYRVHLNRLKGVYLLNEVVRKVNLGDLKVSQVVRIIWCGISIVHHFHIRLKVGSGLSEWTRRRQAHNANTCFEHLMTLLLPDMYSVVIHSMVTFFEEARLWGTELLCTQLLEVVISHSHEQSKAMNVLLDIVEQSNPIVAKKILRVIYFLLEKDYWSVMDLGLVSRFLDMYKESIIPDEQNQDYTFISKGLELCLRALFCKIKKDFLYHAIDVMLSWCLTYNFPNEILLDFGNVIEFASVTYKANLLSDYFSANTVNHIFVLIQSDNVLKSLLGTRIFQHLINRHGNKTIFDVPKIFFQNGHFNINTGIYDTQDKEFLKKYRELIHNSLLISVQNHGLRSRINIESLYCVVALLVVEIPCGYTAAAMACLMMAIQELTISASGVELECTNRIHAIVMSVMSLICWIHNAEIFYDYLNTILHRRAELAPHLNPPLQVLYQYARNHVLWNKPDLFFEDWEVRYGLWKCFRSMRGADSNMGIVVEKDGKLRLEVTFAGTLRKGPGSF
ncbi:uncharacterized protein [Onthophagus taurus]|uniref:uncharacterized protein n=1 Tax=Onthophagus taurus TaxID=166361 RepID=UPI000C2082EA|nr:uncharacterized protein LOC111426248 [Onthophagus taurus]